MDVAFHAIGFEISDETAFNSLAETVGMRGEATALARKSGTLHGRCLKFGAGLEVWMVLYESRKGEIVYADCRPAFRARYAQRISPWILTEFAEEGEAVIHGFIENSDAEVMFQLQNLTEVSSGVFELQTLSVGLCGLAYQAEVALVEADCIWQPYDEVALNVIVGDCDWCLGGRVKAFETIRNPHSGNDLFWVYVDVGSLHLEVLVNRNDLEGEKLQVGAYIKADVWLQGHILHGSSKRPLYEGVDLSTMTVDFWKHFKKPN